MTDNNLPPLPPGFELEESDTSSPPPLPPGFVLESEDGQSPLEIEIIGGRRESGINPRRADFSGVQAFTDTTEQTVAPDGRAYAKYDGPGLKGVRPLTPGELAGYNETVNATYDPEEAYAAELSNKRQDFARMPAIQRAGIGAGSRVAALGRGFEQLVLGAQDAIAPRQQTAGGLIDGQPLSRYQEAMKREERARLRDAYMEGDTAATVGKIGGDVGLLATPGGLVSKGLGLGGKVAVSSALGAGYAGAQPVVDGESRGTNTVIGGLAGAGGELAGKGLGALAQRARSSASSTLERAVKTAREHKIPLHLSQVSESIPAKTAASVAKYLPFSGSGSAAKRQQEAFNKAVASTFGAKATKLSDDVMRDARRKLSSEFEDIYARNNVPISEGSLRRLTAIENEAAERLTEAEAVPLRKQLDKILGEINEGALTGQKYQALRTQIMKAETPDKVGNAIKDIRKALDDVAADAVGPEDAARLKRLRGQWANFRTADGLLKQISGASEDIKPSALWPAIRKGSTKEMRDLARLGQVALKDPIPDSGTAGRLAMGGFMSGGASFAGLGPAGLAGLVLGGATVGRALNSSTLAKMAASTPPGSALSVLSRAAPASGAAAAPIVNKKRRRDDDR